MCTVALINVCVRPPAPLAPWECYTLRAASHCNLPKPLPVVPVLPSANFHSTKQELPAYTIYLSQSLLNPGQFSQSILFTCPVLQHELQLGQCSLPYLNKATWTIKLWTDTSLREFATVQGSRSWRG